MGRKAVLSFIFFLLHISNLIYAPPLLDAQPGAQTANGSGTGFFINNDGVIATCVHVIEDAERSSGRITVMVNSQEYPAQVIASNSETDVAILKINYKNQYHFKISNFNNVKLGDQISLLGYPLYFILGGDIRFTEGSISARNGIKGDPVNFQHSAPTQPGNSGGPIINRNMEVIGIAASVINDDYVKNNAGTIPQNVNFGIKSDYIVNLLNTNTKTGSGNIKNISEAAEATVLILCYSSNNQNQVTITVANRTGYTGKFLYVSPASDRSWGQDRLGNDILSNGRTATVSIPSSSNNRYDVRLVDTDDDTYTKWNVVILPGQNVEFSIKDLDDNENTPASASESRGPPVTIVNNTGYTIYYLYISPASEDKWGPDRLASDQIIRNNQSVTVNLPHPLSVTNKYDIMLKDSDGDTYSKFNITVRANGRIVFTIGDMDLD